MEAFEGTRGGPGSPFWRDAVRGAVGLVLVAALGAGSSWWMRRDNPAVRVASVRVARLSAGDAARIPGESRLWVDARRRQDFENGHLRGAVFVEPDDSIALDAVAASWRPGMRVVVYARPLDRLRARRVAVALQEEAGLPGVALLDGDWRNALALESPPPAHDP